MSSIMNLGILSPLGVIFKEIKFYARDLSIAGNPNTFSTSFWFACTDFSVVVLPCHKIF